MATTGMTQEQYEAFQRAKDYVITFGKYRDQSIDKIARTKDGLEYLVWVVNQEWFGDTSKYPSNEGRLRAVQAFLANPDVQDAVNELKAQRGNRAG